MRNRLWLLTFSLVVSAMLTCSQVEPVDFDTGEENGASTDDVIDSIGESVNETDSTYFFKNEMRAFVKRISARGKEFDKDFLTVPQNGIELITKDGTPDGVLSLDYLNAIDAHGQESLFYGDKNINIKTNSSRTEYVSGFLQKSKNSGNVILITDYCYSRKKVDNSISSNVAKGFVPFSADKRELSKIPDYPLVPYNINGLKINDLSEASNFLYLLNYAEFDSKEKLIASIRSTDYDLLIIDVFFNDGAVFTADEIAQMRTKNNGGSRLILAYMSIGEAEDYRFYWDSEWKFEQPYWLVEENENWPGNYKVRYWEAAWQNIILGPEKTSYLSKIFEANFDGVYLDIIDAFEYFEN